ncbi:hypothetical protein [Geomonas sp.]|uniref:hypothetical protein n=1 Tax=Geomonas sp. TaxID=2651584 RepID=UPI002B467B52|nr:hypothetical protein [Geomonas sp.]HJV34621.1 hypothetical protein [Geomonas sp.]
MLDRLRGFGLLVSCASTLLLSSCLSYPDYPSNRPQLLPETSKIEELLDSYYDCHGVEPKSGSPAPISVVLGAKRDPFVDCDAIRVRKTAAGIELVAIRDGADAGSVELVKGKDYLVESSWITLPPVNQSSGGWFQSIRYKLTLNQNMDLVAYSNYFASGSIIIIPVFENHKGWLIFSNKGVSCEVAQPLPWPQLKEDFVQEQMRELRLIKEK